MNMRNVKIPAGFFIPSEEHHQLLNDEWMIEVHDYRLMTDDSRLKLHQTRAFAIFKQRVATNSTTYEYRGGFFDGKQKQIIEWFKYADVQEAVNSMCAKYRILK